MSNEENIPLDLAAVRERLAGAKGKEYWRSLEEVAETPAFQKWVEDEFPERASLLNVDRRQFLTLMGASLALAGLAGCRNMPQEKLVPYVKAPEEIIPGIPLAYATAFVHNGYALGVLARSNMGRPTKIEGNPDHPASRGATDIFAQASLLGLYDPDRSKTVLNDGEITTWDAFLRAARTAMTEQRALRGAGLRILTETVTSPTLADQINGFLRAFPGARWHQWEPTGRESARAGARAAFGEYVDTIYRFDRANVILSLDSNFLQELPGSVRYAREFMDGRRVRKGRTTMNRLYVVESTPTITGATADHRLPLRPSEVEGVARALAARLGVDLGGAAARPAAVPEPWLAALAEDLQANRGRAIVVPGEQQTAAVHALAHAINQALGSSGATVVHTTPVEARPEGQAASLRALVDDMEAGQVSALLILGGNPVYNAPADIPFAAALTRKIGDRFATPLRIHLSLYQDETSALCNWHIPEAHYLEAWSDAPAYDGTIAIVQPLIEPLYGGKSSHELLAALTSEPRPGYDIVRDYWRRQRPGDNFDRFWESALNVGVVPGTAKLARTVTVQGGLGGRIGAPAAGSGMEIVFPPDPSVGDGRFANNVWLQELPKPLTKMVWDNAALLSPAAAQENAVTTGDRIEIDFKGRSLQAAVWVVPGHPDGVITLHLGYGRAQAGLHGTGIGFNAYALRTSDALGFGTGASLRKAGGRYLLVSTQTHHSMEGRDIVRVAALDAFIQDPALGREDHFYFRAGKAGAASPEAGAPGGVPPQDQNPPAAEGESAEARPENDTHEAGHGHGDEFHGDRTPREGGGVQSTISIYPEKIGTFDYDKYNAWGMVIDLNTCIGCNACTIACQAENNIPSVGKIEVERGREMHWIRVDRYYRVNENGARRDPRERGDIAFTDQGVFAPDKIETVFQPLTCMHCEKAPCEPVCPVAATVHSHEGLNQMVYNRCVGTRYCSNNCPYKVRRFNFLNYANHHEYPQLKMLNNPDVTVRGRGVMEKCTYCVQRISRARIEAKKADAPIKDGDVVTACQQVCPTQAIIFGDINDANSQVRQLKEQPHNYYLLAELNTQPRTTYLARLRNPNPALEAAAITGTTE